MDFAIIEDHDPNEKPNHISLKNRERHLDMRHIRAIQMLIDGAKDEEVAKAVGVSKATIYNWRTKSHVFQKYMDIEVKERTKRLRAQHHSQSARIISKAAKLLEANLDLHLESLKDENGGNPTASRILTIFKDVFQDPNLGAYAIDPARSPKFDIELVQSKTDNAKQIRDEWDRSEQKQIEGSEQAESDTGEPIKSQEEMLKEAQEARQRHLAAEKDRAEKERENNK